MRFSPIMALTLLLAGCGGGSSGGDTAPPVAAPPVPTLSLPSTALSAAELAVLVAEGDTLSEAIASHYQTARGLAASQLIRLRLPSRSDVISAADFALLKAEIDARLPGSAQASLLTWTAPSRVAGPSCSMSITSALALGFDERYCSNRCGATAASPLYDSESRRPWSDHRIRPAMMLGARTLEAAQALIARGLAADASQPGGDGYLLRSSDAARSVRYPDYLALPAAWAGRLRLEYLDNAADSGSDSLDGRSNVLFYFTGLSRVPGLAGNGFRPGAVADHLTSFGGHLPDGRGQMPVTAWLDAGATASYGTVEEPCNFTQKFSRASVLIDHYYRGASLIEAYWKSVQWPGQGLFVGEPLARPFADAPSFTIDGGQYLISTRALRPGSAYALEYQDSAGAWIALAGLTPERAQMQTLRAPLPPGGTTRLRWVGPCPTDSAQRCTLASSG
ncbi:TIGR03790 family protein [Paucibacter sp. XJ19-41]|uniref:TIGR03790 family protein n=1 Tax=Paucibacter sp. XJ19-41 TaxID=2927824 RepID=UPI00234AA8F6|nr:TIGR03790 family protein [Paucibacter sp. XJ19-41]MDC6167122.1 TIGR03790 family protein [Paucibacter sp. XJ19-41]